MIYNDRFVWLHFPKCGGTKVERIFNAYFSDQEGLIQDPIDYEDPLVIWHDSIHDREKRDPDFEVGERTIVCSFRRLPSWLESRYNFNYQQFPNVNHDPELLLEGRYRHPPGHTLHADAEVRRFLPETILETGKVEFLRVEHFEADFRSIFGRFIDISRIPDSQYKTKVNTSIQHIPKSIRKQLYSEQKKIYEKCPYWSSIERMAYGQIYTNPPKSYSNWEFGVTLLPKGYRILRFFQRTKAAFVERNFHRNI